MAIRIIEYTVGADSITPATLQAGGVQGEHNATLLQFKIDNDLWKTLQEEKKTAEGSELIYRFDCADGVGNEHPSSVEVALSQTVNYFLPRCLTEHGGKVTVNLVITLYPSSDTELYSCSASLWLKAKNGCFEHKERESISALAYDAKVSADKAEKAVEETRKNLNSTEEAAKLFEEGSEVIFSGGNASGYDDGSEFTIGMTVDTAVNEGSRNPVAGGAVFKALAGMETKIGETNNVWQQYVDDGDGNVRGEFETYKNGIAAYFSGAYGGNEKYKVTGEDERQLSEGSWNYLKLSNGLVMCWGFFDISEDVTVEKFSKTDNDCILYKSEIISITLPFTMYWDSFFCGSASNSFTVGNGILNANETGKSDVLKFRFSRAYDKSGTPGKTRLLIIGKIEEETTNE